MAAYPGPTFFGRADVDVCENPEPSFANSCVTFVTAASKGNATVLPKPYVLRIAVLPLMQNYFANSAIMPQQIAVQPRKDTQQTPSREALTRRAQPAPPFFGYSDYAS